METYSDLFYFAPAHNKAILVIGAVLCIISSAILASTWTKLQDAAYARMGKSATFTTVVGPILSILGMWVGLFGLVAWKSEVKWLYVCLGVGIVAVTTVVNYVSLLRPATATVCLKYGQVMVRHHRRQAVIAWALVMLSSLSFVIYGYHCTETNLYSGEMVVESYSTEVGYDGHTNWEVAYVEKDCDAVPESMGSVQLSWICAKSGNECIDSYRYFPCDQATCGYYTGADDDSDLEYVCTDCSQDMNNDDVDVANADDDAIGTAFDTTAQCLQNVYGEVGATYSNFVGDCDTCKLLTQERAYPFREYPEVSLIGERPLAAGVILGFFGAIAMIAMAVFFFLNRQALQVDESGKSFNLVEEESRPEPVAA